VASIARAGLESEQMSFLQLKLADLQGKCCGRVDQQRFVSLSIACLTAAERHRQEGQPNMPSL
jgi:hypothetical protein